MTQRSIHRLDRGQDESSNESSLRPGEASPTGLRILWGRLLLLLVALALAFLAGRSTAPPDASEAELRAVQAELDSARERVDELEAAALAEPEPTPTESPAPAAPEDEEPAEPEPAEERIYVVRAGDTLSEIAERFYENASMGDVIAEANDITDPAQLSVGRELVIPEKPEL
jgi:nucleoid-associated protein YgaU